MHSNGVTVIAVTQERPSDINTTWNKERQNSPVESSEVPIAANASTATAVAPSRGMADCWATSIVASLACMPCFILMSVPSTTTMALSTSMPRAMISAPSDIRCNEISHGSMKINVAETVSTNTKPIIKPARRPIANNNTMITIATAWYRLMRKLSIAMVTERDCSEIMPNSMPSGILSVSSFMRTSSASPMVTALPPVTVEMPSPIAG